MDEEPGYLLKDLALPFIVDSKQGNAKYKKEAVSYVILTLAGELCEDHRA